MEQEEVSVSLEEKKANNGPISWWTSLRLRHTSQFDPNLRGR
jgi:hypothetical protein